VARFSGAERRQSLAEKAVAVGGVYVSGVFRVGVPVSYCLLFAMWAFMLFFFLRRLRTPVAGDRLIAVLLIILSINALVSVLDSTYFGLWYAARARRLSDAAPVLPELAAYAIAPKLLNVAAAALMIGLLIRYWRPSAGLPRSVRRRAEESDDPPREKEELIAELEQLSLKDALTGVYNRRGFWALAERHARLAHGKGAPFCLLYGDLDGLKWINDNYGHTTGDAVLEATARVLTESFRDSDIVARMGGDEFVVLLAGTPETEVEAGVQRLKANMERCRELAEMPFKPSISLGTACYGGRDEPDIEALIGRADRRMYEQKRLRPGRSNGNGDPADYGLPLRTSAS
jgi:diguanylate cyclase (GGDEF)-like protein